MSQELTKKLMCIAIRGGMEVWLEEDRAKALMDALEQKRDKGFVRVDGQFVNIADVQGIFDAKTMEERTRTKNGQWKCKRGEWHERFKQCDCPPVNEKGEIFIKGQGWMKI